MVIQCASAVKIFLIGSGVGIKNDSIVESQRFLQVYHIGMHMCSPTPNIKK